MKYASKKIISVVLIVAMVFVNNGFFVLADSIEKVVEENTLNQEESEKFYYEETLVEEKVSIEYENLQESEETTIEENENDSTKENVEESLDAEKETEVEEELEEETEIKEEDIEEKEEDELVDATNESLNENDVENITLEENINEIEKKDENNEEEENKSEIQEEAKEEKLESKEALIRKEEKAESENETVVNKEKTEINEEATISEVEKIEEIVFEDEKISTESNVEKNEEIYEKEIEKATESNIEELNKIVEVATNSEIEESKKNEEVLATESFVEKQEEEVATTSEAIRIATISEIEEVATASEVIRIATEFNVGEKTKVYATVSVINWKVKKILIATYSKAYTRLNVNETGENNLAKFANIILVNDEGEEKVVRVPLKWKLEKRFNTSIANNSNIDRKNEKEEDVDAYIDENIKEKTVIPATSSVAKVIEKIKSEINDEKNEAIITVLNEVKKEELKVENNNEVLEEENEETILDDKEEENFIEIKEEETFIEVKEETEIVKEEKIDDFDEEEIAPTVAGFDNTEIVDESNENNIIATQGEVENNQEELMYEEGFINAQKENGEKQINSIEVYSIDNESLSNEILNILNEENNQENNKNEGEEDKKGLFNGILSFLGLNKEENEENIKEEKEDVAIGILGTSVPKIFTQINLGAPLVGHAKGNHTIMSTLDSDTVNAKIVNMKMFTGDDNNYETGESNPWLPYYYHTIVGGEDRIDASREEVVKENMETLYPRYATQNQIVMEGNYYLNDDLVINEKWIIRPGKVLRICLNGKSIRFNLKKNSFTEFFEEGRIGKAIDIDGKVANGENAGGGALIICNCADTVSTITASTDTGEKFVENCKDADFGKSGTKYTRWKAHALINTEKVFIAGSKKSENNNIVFNDTDIKNCYRDEVKVVDKNDERDYPDFTGDGSLVAARELCVITNTEMKNAKAARAVGVFVNTLFGRLIVYNSKFSGGENSTGNGGAIAFNTKSTYMEKVEGEKSSAVSNGGILYGKTFPYSFPGKLVYDSLEYGATGTYIKNCKFDGGSVYNNGGTLFLDDFGGDRRNSKQVWTQPIVAGCDQVNIISTKFTNSKEKEDLIGYQGGMISLKHYNTDPCSADYSYNVLSPGKMYIKDCTFVGASAKNFALTTNIFGGAIALCDQIDNKLIKSVVIEGKNNENTFENCVLNGNNIESGKPTGQTSLIENVFNGLNYGGAIYVKNVDNIILKNVTMNKNTAFAGANLYINNSNLILDKVNIIEGKGGENNDKSDNIYNKVVTPAGSAIYLANRASVSVINSTIKNNINAFFVDNCYSDREAILSIENCDESKIVGNTGEYLIGFSNKGNNRVIFNNAQITNHNFRGNRKDFYYDVDDGYSGARVVYSKVQFFGTKNYIRDNKRKRVYNGNTETTRICNLEIRSSRSNIRLDLLNMFDVNANQAGGKGIDKIGLTYDIEDDDTDLYDSKYKENY